MQRSWYKILKLNIGNPAPFGFSAPEEIGTAIELGGQDAKIIFFQEDKRTGELQVADMRMNGSCAGGTGAFVDEIASLLKTPVEEFDALAAQGTTVYDISGRNDASH